MCNDRTGNLDVIMGYSVVGMLIVVMVHGRCLVFMSGNVHNSVLEQWRE